MAKVQKVYTREFKEQAVQLVQTSGKTIAQLARELSISDTSIHQWRKELTEYRKEAFLGSVHQTPLEEENRRPKRELKRVQQERDIVKKSCGHLFMGIQMTYQCIDQHKQEFPIVVMCRVLEVSESGFYAWRKCPTCQHKREDAQLTEEIRQVFHAHHGRYGCPRLHAELHDQGRSISRKRVTRLMSEAGLCAKRNRRRVLTTRQDPTHAVAPNTFNRDFTAPEPPKNG